MIQALPSTTPSRFGLCLPMAKYGEALLDRRDWLNLDGPQLAALSREYQREDPLTYQGFSQQTYSRWERDRTGAIITASAPGRIRSLARALQWSLQEFEANVGVPTGWSGNAPSEEQPPMRLAGGLILVPVMGSANGGRPHEYGLVPVKPSLVRGDNTRAYEVMGDSMDTGQDNSIRDGDWVLVDTSIDYPINGKVYLLEIVGDGMTVKRLRQVGGAWLFMSDNPAVNEVWRDDEVRIVGQVYGGVDYKEIE